MTRRGTIVYVHGASDRAAQVDDHVARIEVQLRRAALDFDVMPNRWGEAAGADLGRIEAALPPPARPAGWAPSVSRAMVDLARLAGTATTTRVTGSAGDGHHRQADELLDICRAQVGQPGETIRLRDGREVLLAVACRTAADAVAESGEYVRARVSAASEPLLIDAVGRAIAAAVAATAAAPGAVARTVQVRIAEAILGAAAATILAGYLGIDVGPDLKRWATDVLLPHRGRLVREAGLGPADIVLYLRNGEAIRRHVAASLGEVIARGGQVVALGNSLGGIILGEVLAEPGAPRPDLLVTVGSQAPLLATFGAFGDFATDGARAFAPFQPWLNVYDRRDLLGFVAQGVWPDQPGITDHEVDLGVGFPDSHGAAYLSHPDVFRAIDVHPALAVVAPRARRRRTGYGGVQKRLS